LDTIHHGHLGIVAQRRLAAVMFQSLDLMPLEDRMRIVKVVIKEGCRVPIRLPLCAPANRN